MTRYAKILLPVVATIVLGGLFLMTGCSDDDPVTPVHLPESGYLAVSPDSLMSLWKTALSTMDSTMYGDMYDPAFRFQFSAGDMEEFQLLTEYMTRDETVQTAWNMFSGQDITNWQGEIGHGVSRIYFPFMTQDSLWEAIAAGPNTMASARFTLQMFVERGGYTILAATGTYDFVAMSRDTTDGSGAAVQYYQLVSMVEIGPVKESGVIHTWGGVHLEYLINEGPEAALLVTDIGGTPLPLYRCDASGSRDADSGLHPEPYRWQFETGGGWTDWSADPITTHEYPATGMNTITVEVRDRWGASDTASQDVNVPYPDLPFPSNPDQLMANFQTVYEFRYAEGYKELMHPDFLTILQQSTTDEFPDVGTTLDFNEERRIHERMFSGEVVTDPDGIFVPGVRVIVFQVFRALDAWALSPQNDIIPNAEWAPFEVDFLFDRGQNFSFLKASGTIKFYVTSRDSLHEGVTKQYYEMIGQVDLTNIGKAVEESNWGSLKALWR